MTTEKHVVFTLDDRRFGLPIADVERILAAPGLTRVPRSPREMRGVFDLRGDVLPVLDSRALLGLGEAEPVCLLVVQCNGRRLALTADRVESIVELGVDDIQSVTAESGRKVQVGKVGDRLVLLLDLPEMISESLGKSAESLAELAA